MRCPCFSGKKYSDCCQPFHKGESPPTPETLMRSRYSGYALGLSEYIIATTHPHNPNFKSDRALWKSEIAHFSAHTQFEGLIIYECWEKGKEGKVAFTAILKQNGHDISFTEKSRFLKEGGRWLYRDGNISD